MTKIDLDVPKDVLATLDLLIPKEQDRDSILNAVLMDFLEKRAVEIALSHRGGVASEEILTLNSLELIKRYI